MEQTFSFTKIPANSQELSLLPEAVLDSPFKTAALIMLSLLTYESAPDNCFVMLDSLRGPEPLSTYAKSFIKERLSGKTYKAKSFFAGASVENSYTPSQPLSITISDNPYSYAEENRAVLYVKSAGADSPRPLKFRRKPSTNQWFLEEIMCLSDIREPAASDPWA